MQACPHKLVALLRPDFAVWCLIFVPFGAGGGERVVGCFWHAGTTALSPLSKVHCTGGLANPIRCVGGLAHIFPRKGPNSTGPSQTPGFQTPAWTCLSWTYRAQPQVSAWIRLRPLLGCPASSGGWLTWHLEHALAKPCPRVQLPMASSCCPALSASCLSLAQHSPQLSATLQVELESAE